MTLAIIAVALLFGLWWFTRQGELFCLSVRRGKVLVIRGRIPPGLLSDIKDTVASSSVQHATIRAFKTERGGRLTFSGGLSEGLQQRFRNMFGLCPIAHLRNAPAIAKPTLGQVVGIAWIAWLLDSWRRG
jgi:phosphatidate phosphatase APP1